MATYIALVDYTEQGIRNIQDSPKRSDAFTRQAEEAGIKIKDLYWTVGDHDGVVVFEAPDEIAASALMLSLSRGGNVRTRTLRAFDRTEMEQILSKTS